MSRFSELKVTGTGLVRFSNSPIARVKEAACGGAPQATASGAGLMTTADAEQKLDREDRANDPAEESIRELFVLLVTWGFFWAPIAAFGWLVYIAISTGIPSTALPRPWPEAIGLLSAYLIALTALLRSDRRSGVIARNIMPALRSAARRFAFPTTLIVGGLIGALLTQQSGDTTSARYVATACARTPTCTDYAARLSAGEVDVQGYLITTAR